MKPGDLWAVKVGRARNVYAQREPTRLTGWMGSVSNKAFFVVSIPGGQNTLLYGDALVITPRYVGWVEDPTWRTEPC